jgi:signal transduction histidine kinase
MTPRADLVQDVAVADHVAVERMTSRARIQFLVTCLIATVALAALSILLTNTVAGQEERAEAQSRAAIVAAVVGAWGGEIDNPADDQFTQAVRATAGEQAVSHVLVWRRDGTVVWADDPRLIGRTFDMHADLQALFNGSGSLIGRPGPVDLEGAEAPIDVNDDIEVFVPTTGAADEPLVVESYIVRSALANHHRAALGMLLPYVMAAFVLLQASYLALGLLLGRLTRRGRRGRIRITSAAIRAMETERRELAQELHDGIVQDLAAVRYALGAIAVFVPPGLDHRPREELERIQQVLNEDLLDLRSLLGHLLPPDFESRSLEGALRALVRQVAPPQLRCRFELDCPEMNTEESLIVYRVVREGVSNAVRHARCNELRVLVRLGPGAPAGLKAPIQVMVEDDGRGTRARSTVPSDEAAPDLHHGLTLIAGLMRDHGGTLTVTARDDGPGTRVLATLPRQAPPPL